jgi:hypothetical protein
MQGLKTERTTSVVIRGHAHTFVQNLSRRRNSDSHHQSGKRQAKRAKLHASPDLEAWRSPSAWVFLELRLLGFNKSPRTHR